MQIIGEYPPTKKKHDLEWRADGMQSVVRGLHLLTGDPYRIINGEVPLRIEFSRLTPVLADLFAPDGEGDGAEEDTSWAKDYPGINFDELDLVARAASVGIPSKQDLARASPKRGNGFSSLNW